MARFRLDAPIRDMNGNITTIAAIADAGLIEFRKVTCFQHRGRVRTAYFADFTGTMTGFEIGRLAYESRTLDKVTMGAGA
jgi:hypothetical protein